MSTAPLILGHRGASALAPENTLAAFARAIDDGADGIEFDVRLSRDGIPVVIHDATLKRTALIDGSVAEMTAAELRAVDVGSWFTGRSTESFRGENLPTLAQVFELFSTNDGQLYVEMKCDKHEGSELASAVVKLTSECRMVDRVVVESFDHAAIAAVKKADSGIRTAALFEPRLTRPLSTIRRLKMVDTALAFGADEIALHHTLVGPRIVEKAMQAGLEVVVWTVDETAWIARARKLGIKALIANNPGSMVRSRDGANTN
ncbi:MAG TPA: glycerophosphodiester phosphodiesterase family protein [Pyrinomonadaceae bacterium]|jgi:glycerophosphoryl diester phosphodiesterase|nr:glycerophosphodiester phosphodiesterase family protein [Pyrinomonadaceae bacterium]